MIRAVSLAALVATVAACTSPAEDYAAQNRAGPAPSEIRSSSGGPNIKFSGYARYGVKIIR